MARPTVLTPDVQTKIVDAISVGNYYEAAAASAGISYQSLRNWIKRGEDELERVATTPRARIRKKEEIYVDFVQAVREAEAKAETMLVTYWRAQVPNSWQAARDFLARRFPERWSNKERYEHTGEGGGPVGLVILPSKDGNE